MFFDEIIEENVCEKKNLGYQNIHFTESDCECKLLSNTSH